MDVLSGIEYFVQAAETRSFSAAGRNLGVRLLHRSTRSITLTAEGVLFLERCRRILSEVEAAELELSEIHTEPKGKLRVSFPLVGQLVMPVLTSFMHRYPLIELDVDFSDRMVDVIEEGFDAVIRTGEPADSRLMSRPLGNYSLVLVASPEYLSKHGHPQTPADLVDHACLQHKFPSTGKYEAWPLRAVGNETTPTLNTAMVCNTSEALIAVARAGLGIACLPDFMVREAISKGELVTVLNEHIEHQGTFRMLWPSSKHLAPKLRVFIDFMVEELFKA